jgi:hypothetical protein
MVMYLFCKFRNSLRHPLHVLRMFLYFYQSFPWESYVLTLEGPKAIQIGPVSTPTNANHKGISSHSQQQNLFEKDFSCENAFQSILQPLIQQFHDFQRSKHPSVSSPNDNTTSTVPPPPTQRFPLRVVNIQDPVDKMNNLSYSVTRHNLPFIMKALALGYQNLENLILILGKPIIPAPMNNVAGAYPNNMMSPALHLMSPSSVTTSPVPVVGEANIINNTNNNNSNNRRNSKNFSSFDNGKSFPSTFPPIPNGTGYSLMESNNHHHLHPMDNSLKWSQHPILNEVFSISLLKYVLNGNLRSDLLEHPLQQFNSARSNSFSTPTSSSALAAPPSSSTASVVRKNGVLLGDSSLAENYFQTIEKRRKEAKLHHSPRNHHHHSSPRNSNKVQPPAIVVERDGGVEEDVSESKVRESSEDEVNSSISEEEEEEEEEEEDRSTVPLESPVFFEKDRETNSSLAPTVSSTSESSQNDENEQQTLDTSDHQEEDLEEEIHKAVIGIAEDNLDLEEEEAEEKEEIETIPESTRTTIEQISKESIRTVSPSVEEPQTLIRKGQNSGGGKKKKGKKGVKEFVAPINSNRNNTNNSSQAAQLSSEKKNTNNNLPVAIPLTSTPTMDLLQPDKTSLTQYLLDLEFSLRNYYYPLLFCVVTTLSVFGLLWVYYNILFPFTIASRFIANPFSTSAVQKNDELIIKNKMERSSLKDSKNNDENSVLDYSFMISKDQWKGINNLFLPQSPLSPPNNDEEGILTTTFDQNGFVFNPWEYSSSYLKSTNAAQRIEQEKKEEKETKQKQKQLKEQSDFIVENMIKNLIEQHSSSLAASPYSPPPTPPSSLSVVSPSVAITSISSFEDEDEHISPNLLLQTTKKSTTTTIPAEKIPEEEVPVLLVKRETTTQNKKTIPLESNNNTSIVNTNNTIIAATKQADDKSSTTHPKEDHSKSTEDTFVIPAHFVNPGDSLSIGDYGALQEYLESKRVPSSSKQFLWQKDGKSLTITSIPILSLENVKESHSGHYQCFEMIGCQSKTEKKKKNKNSCLEGGELRLYLETNIQLLRKFLFAVISLFEFRFLLVNFFPIFPFSEKPRIKTRPFYQEAKAGKSLILSLDVEGIPPPSFQWFRNGYPLPDQLNQTLVIEELDKKIHGGTYACEVKNIAGKYFWSEVIVHISD